MFIDFSDEASGANNLLSDNDAFRFAALCAAGMAAAAAGAGASVGPSAQGASVESIGETERRLTGMIGQLSQLREKLIVTHQQNEVRNNFWRLNPHKLLTIDY